MPEEMEEMLMPIWQDHEKRLTTMEVTITGFSNKIDGVEKAVKDSNQEQKELLNTLIKHHLTTNKMKLSSFWKVIINIFGAGGIITTIILAAIQILQM